MARKPRDHAAMAWAVAVANIVRRERLKRKLSQRDLGLLAERDRNDVSTLEIQGASPELRTLESYALAFEIDIHEFVRMIADEKDRLITKTKRGTPIVTDARKARSVATPSRNSRPPR
jgi:transcriptional regulator with XRE-family HTH domain